MTYTRRGAIQTIESHFGRALRSHVQGNAQSLVTMLDRGHYGTLEKCHQVIRLVSRELLKDVEECNQAVALARQLPEGKKLDDFVRYMTLPKWVESMRELGFEWNPDRNEFEETR